MNEKMIEGWMPFCIGDLFTIKKGSRLTRANMMEGDINFVGASASNNGITAHISNRTQIHPPGTITVAYNGSIGSSFYQEAEYWATDDVNVFYPKFEMNRNIALFLCTVLRKSSVKYRFLDKWTMDAMSKDTIMLPVDDDGNPNWKYMDDYMARTLANATMNIELWNDGLVAPS